MFFCSLKCKYIFYFNKNYIFAQIFLTMTKKAGRPKVAASEKKVPLTIMVKARHRKEYQRIIKKFGISAFFQQLSEGPNGAQDTRKDS